MQPAPVNPLVNMLPIAAIFVIFYFLLIRPQQKQQAEHEAMLKAVKPGDKILTSGGLYGLVVGLKGEDLEVQFSSSVKLIVARSAVSKLLSTDAGAPAKSVV